MSVNRDEVESTPLVTEYDPSGSKYTFQNLEDLNDPKVAYASPLSVIALIDLNAFFAQVEQIRLNLPPDAPVVCAQWQSLIAVSYAARKFGINRMDTISSARKKCPDMVIGHAAVFRKGESYWSYVPGLPDQAVHKVSLDPYRRESRKIVKVFQEHCDLVEKASVDESYLDLGRLIYHRLIELFPELTRSSSVEKTDALPPLPDELPSSIQWVGEVIPTEREDSDSRERDLLSESQKPPLSNAAINDWDDVCMAIGSQILLELRKSVYKKLGYFTSGGLARNKLVAKIAAGYRKPDNQTIIRTQSIYGFLKNFELNDITGMGGKIGEIVMRKFDIPPGANSISYIREHVSLDTLEEEFRNDKPLARKVYDIVRGDHKSELTHRVETKSMMSRKNFMAAKPVSTFQDANDWLMVFAGDLYNRMIELDDENLNLSMSQQSSKEKGAIKRPKTISIHYGSTDYSRHSRQAPLPLTRSLTKLKELFEKASVNLFKELMNSTVNLAALNNGKTLKELENDQRKPSTIKIAPLANLSLTISNFVKTSDSNLIDTYADGGLLGTEESAKDSIKKMFDEVNNEAKLKIEEDMKNLQNSSTSRASKNTMSEANKEYISKLFKDFDTQAGTNGKDQEKPHRSNRPAEVQPPRTISKDDSTYIKKLFEEFHSENTTIGNPPKKSINTKRKSQSPVEREHSPIIAQRNDSKVPNNLEQSHIKRAFDRYAAEQVIPPVSEKSNNLKRGQTSQGNSKKPDILQSLKKHKPMESSSSDPFIDELVSTGYCRRCNQSIEDAFEHSDFHAALELSEKINGPT